MFLLFYIVFVSFFGTMISASDISQWTPVNDVASGKEDGSIKNLQWTPVIDVASGKEDGSIKNLRMTCHFIAIPDDSGLSLKSLSIYKQGEDNILTELISMTSSLTNVVERTILGAHVTGHFDDSRSFIRFTWFSPGEEAKGQYTCDAQLKDVHKKQLYSSSAIKDISANTKNSATRKVRETRKVGDPAKGQCSNATIRKYVVDRHLRLLNDTQNKFIPKMQNFESVMQSEQNKLDNQRALLDARSAKINQLKQAERNLSGRLELEIEHSKLSPDLFDLDLQIQKSKLVNMVDVVRRLDRRWEDFELADTFADHIYILSKVTVKSSAMERELSCEILGGYVAEMDNVDEHNFIKNFLKAKNSHATKVFVSGYKKKGGQWVSQRTGHELKHLEWTPGSPNGDGNCIELIKAYSYTMNDLPCNYAGPARFLCEINGPGEDFEFSASFNDHIYFLSANGTGLTDAQRKLRCNSVGGYLAEIDTNSEHEFIRKFITHSVTKPLHHDSRVYVAGHKDSNGRWFYQRTGRNISKAFWAPNQPDETGKCINLIDTYTINYYMDDNVCVAPGLSRFLCEASEAKNDFLFETTYDDHLYFLSEPYKNMLPSQRALRCRQVGGYLVELDSSEEHEFLMMFLEKSIGKTDFVLISGELVAGIWVSVRTGRYIGWSGWFPGEPNSGLKCRALNGAFGYMADDIQCNIGDDIRFLCEVPLTFQSMNK